VKFRNGVLPGLLAFLLAFAGPLSHVAPAQTNQIADPESALDAKADKLLKQTYRAAAQFRGAVPGRSRAAAQEVADLSGVTGVSLSPDGGVSVRLLVQLGAGGADDLRDAGFGVGAVVGDIATVTTDAGRLPELASLASVQKMWASTFRHPANDRARESVGIDSGGHRALAQTGKGVVVGTVDTGIDFRHPDFTVPGSGGTRTRIKFLLDMTVTNPTTITVGGQSFDIDANWNYTLPGSTVPVGRLYTESDINAALAAAKPADQNSDIVKERDKSGHGTHVAGTAAGNGLAGSAPGLYAGMAPEADLVIVKASRENDGTASFGSDDEVNALQFIQTKAGELGEPFVINMSLGGQAGPHDGTGPDEIAIDNIVNGGAGRAVCIAAGNEGSDSIHAQTTVPANGGSVTLHFNATSKPSFIDLYSAPRGTSGSGRYSVAVTEPGGTQPINVNFDANGFAQQSGQFSDSSVQIWDALDDKLDSDPSNDQADIFMLFKSGAKTGTWTITLTNGASEPASSFDAWADGDKVSFASDSFVDNNSHLIGSPGAARGAITVGAYVTRSGQFPINSFAFFTSPGPTADGRRKPEISAPGYIIYSTKTGDLDPTNGVKFSGISPPANQADLARYDGLAGTSMATPVVAGSVALLFQANRNLTSDQVKTLIETNANHDGFDPPGWDAHFGFGRLNIAAAMNVVSPTPTPTPTPTPSPTPTPTPVPTPTPQQQVDVTGRVLLSAQQGLSGASVTLIISGVPVQQATTDANGSYTFTGLLIGGNYNLQFSKTGYNFNPSSTGFTLTQSNLPDAVATKADSIDDSAFFVTHHYQVFLNRTPDSSGLAFWTQNIESCRADFQCRDVKRVDTSAAFFLSIEFQETGYLVYRLHKAAFGNLAGKPVPVVRSVFLADTQTIGRTPAQVIVGQTGWQQQLEANKQAFTNSFVGRTQFTSLYPTTRTPAQFVDALFANAGITPSATDRNTAIGEFGAASDTTDQAARARALRDVAENASFSSAEFDRAFVLMQYFGYLQRDPDAAPDSNFDGYNFWLSKLDGFGGDFHKAEMVKAFISATEYRQRFGN
jgi:subtilisin family serine protease